MDQKSYVIELMGSLWTVRSRDGEAILVGHNIASRTELVSTLVSSGALVRIVDGRTSSPALPDP